MAKDDENKEAVGLKSTDEGIEARKAQDVPKATKDGVSLKSQPDKTADSDEDSDKPYAFTDLDKASASEPPDNIGFILDIPLEISVELGRSKMIINELLKLGQGSVIELSKLAGETLEVLANQKLIARGEVVVVDEKYAIRLTEIVSPTERIEGLK
ncbi:MAG: flagellar motor switch protein FliN [Desulfobacteraceae bacterium]|nr:MAG: flagellar motor switch protein FliN [Desulfobacteraceae bacterium]